MAAFLAAIRRLFPPLKVKRKLWTSSRVLAIYGWVVDWVGQLRASAAYRLGSRVDRRQRTGPGLLDRLSQQPRLRPLVGSPQALGPAHQRKPQPLPESPRLSRRSTRLTARRSAELVIAFAEALKDHLR